MIIVDGKAISQKILDEIRTGLKGRSVAVAALWAGDNQAIGRFVKMKKKAAELVGIRMEIYRFDTPEEMSEKIKELSANESTSGIIVELPLPPNFNREKILNLIPEAKDIDVLSSSAQDNFYYNRSKIFPPAIGAMKILFKEYKINPAGKTAAVFGQSILIGKPISHWLETQGAKVFRIDENTENAKGLCLQADIVVSGVGKPNLIAGEMVKGGAVVIDFGFENLNGKISGDVDFNSAAPKSYLITPVPGGMGPIVIAAFLKNAVRAAQNLLREN